MKISKKISFLLLRLSLGWLFLYSGITKVMKPEWTAEGYMKAAKTFAGFYHWLTQPELLPFIISLNQWGQLLLGISLILGLGVRLSATLGAVLMLLYYFPILDFPYPNSHAFIVDEHIIYALALIVFIVVKAGRIWGLDGWLAKQDWYLKTQQRFNWFG